MKIWIEIQPFTWNIWPLVGSVHGTYPAGELYRYVRVGPVAVCWGAA